MEWDGMEGPSEKFINYNLLDYDDRLLFAHSGLDRFVGIAGKILLKRIGDVRIHKFNEPFFNSRESVDRRPSRNYRQAEQPKIWPNG